MDEDEERVPAPHFQSDEEGPASDEGDGVDLMKSDGNLVGSGGEDSSEEEDDDDPEEARRIAEGFIAEDDEDEEEDEEARRERRRRRKKKRKQNEEDFEVDEDDLELLAENTGQTRRKEAGRLKRFRRGSASPPLDDDAAARQRTLDQIFEDDDDDDEDARRGVAYDEDDDLPSVGQVLRAGVSRKQREQQAVGGYEDDGLDDFIEEDEDEEEMQGLDEEEREARRRERREEKRRARMSGSAADPAKAGIDREAWDEIHEIFGNGEDYYWALEEDDEDAFEEEKKNKMDYKDIFEPAQIAERMLTEEDERIKRIDIPERLQLAFPGEEGLRLLERKLDDTELLEAAKWASSRVSPRTASEFLDDAGPLFRFRAEFLNSVQLMLSYMLNDLLEVPFLFQHRFDDISHLTFDETEGRFKNIELFKQEELSTLSALGLKYKTLLIRKDQLRTTFNKVNVGVKSENGGSDSAAAQDARNDALLRERQVFEDMLADASSLEELSDITEWLTLRYGQRMRDAQSLEASTNAAGAAEDMEGLTLNGEASISATPAGFKKPSLVGQYERVKNTVLSELAKKFGITADELAANITRPTRLYASQDPEKAPLAFAEEFVGAQWGANTAEVALAKARMLLCQEIGKDPVLKREIRQLFKDSAEISIEPTERGMTVIDDGHPYAGFKFLRPKPARQIPGQPVIYLQMLQAEDDILIKLNIGLKEAVLSRFENRLYTNYASEGVGETSQLWNEQRREVIADAVRNQLVPNGRLWLKEWLREESRESLLRKCERLLGKRLDAGPYMSRSMKARNADDKIEEEDRIPRVLAVSHGGGDPKHDVVQTVYLDERHRFREHATFDDLRRPTERQIMEREAEMERTRGRAEFVDHRADFIKLLINRRPDVVVVSGWSTRTAELKQIVAELAEEAHRTICETDDVRGDMEREQAFIEVITCHDDVARIYQHSSRADEEFPELSKLGRYCLALARYVQSPVNEFAALGPNDLTAVILDSDQRLLPQDRLKLCFERAIGTAVNDVGVEINQAITDSYYQTMLPFVAGLGPRKAHALVHAITTKLEGTLINRSLLITRSILPFGVFTNCASFLRIEQDMLLEADGEEVPDVLDSTRIHPEDYDFPRKMAADALNKHEEDLEGEHPSMPCKDLMETDDREEKLGSLDLDNYAQMLYERKGERKRATLYLCKQELIKPYDDLRRPQKEPSPHEILTMFTGETAKTLDEGFVVPVEIVRVENGSRERPGYIRCRLDSGIEGIIPEDKTENEFMPGAVRLRNKFEPTKTLDAIVTSIDPLKCTVQLSIRPWDLQNPSLRQNITPLDDFYDREKAEKWNRQAAEKAKARLQARRQNRVIDHPNFHNFNYKQAVTFLAGQPRGSVVVRPSSKGDDHLAVTWKVDDGVFQNIDVLELDKESEYSLGRILRIEGMGSYSDLDELIVNHVKPMVHMVEMMMNHEKYKGAEEDDLHRYLTNFSLANPTRSAYAFGLNKERPGYFNLSFKANRDAAIQTWPVKVVPNAFKLGPADQLADVAALCNAFKTQYTTQQVSMRGGKTPYGGGRTPMAGGMTPMAGGRTPYGVPAGMAAGRAPGAVGGYGTPLVNAAASGATPNPYGYGRAPAAAPYAAGPPGRPPAMPGAPPGPPPSYPPASDSSRPGPPPARPPVPHGMHPDRFAQAAYGGGAGGGGGGSASGNSNGSRYSAYGGGGGGYGGYGGYGGQ